MKVSVTGPIGSGKSTFAEMLSRNKVDVLSGDDIGRELLMENSEEIFKYLGLDSTGNILEKLKSFFLEDEGIFIKYNQWMYRHLPGRIMRTVLECEDVILDAALVFEWGIDHQFDANITVFDGDFSSRIERLSNIGDIDRQLYRLLDSHQMPVEEKMELADIVVENNGTLEDLREEADEIYQAVFAD